ncbi:MAG: sugar ABC transporter ATP-binding protein [Treponema sp.]|jgi:ABC-type sugar transport system ATPase subunit|nr:sugar ABC transporter ATP-binding protein [Treponema sp.]
MEGRIVFKASNICKSFPGVKALNDVSFELKSGEIFALLGENGAGKSTFIKVMSGIYQPDEGVMEIDGKSAAFPTPRSAFDAGISVVHQELNYIAVLSVAENIMMSNHLVNKLGMVDWKRMYAESKEVLSRLNLDIDPHKIMQSCSTAEKQQIEIAKALYWKAKILILDEPTSALNNAEIENLMHYLEIVKESGVAIVYISHKLEEIFRIADRVGVLRDGQQVGLMNVKNTTPDKLISLMVGRTIRDMYPKENNARGDVIMKANNLGNRVLRNINFEIRSGEILGIYGLLGSGHIELGKMIFGDMPYSEGYIEVEGKRVRIRNPSDALRAGIAYVPSERKTEGLVLIESVQQNIVTVYYEKEKKKLVNTTYNKNSSTHWIQKLRIKTPSPYTPTASLSGGNQQKVVLAKWMEVNPKVLIMVDPTRGIDVGSKTEIYQLLGEFCKQGISIIMITSEMPELLAMSDRVLVMYQGRVNGEFSRDEADQIKVVSAAIGGNI